MDAIAAWPDFTYATPSATKAVLERHGFGFKRSLGQNFLVNDSIIKKIMELAEVTESDSILEVGPGIGTLTFALLSKAKTVISIERDEDLPPVLEDTLKGAPGKFCLVEKDALELGIDDLSVLDAPMPNKLVSNLPYGIAATFVLDCFQELPSIGSATVMVQREVAERMQAKPSTKEYGAYTVKLSLYARSVGSFKVSPSNFKPMPHVESTVIRLDRCDVVPELASEACEWADAAFFARRKTILNSCRQYFSAKDPKLAEGLGGILEAAGIDPKSRGEALSKEDFLRLAQASRA